MATLQTDRRNARLWTHSLVLALGFALALITTVARAEYEFVSEFGDFGNTLGRFNFPGQVATTSDGTIIVADDPTGRVQICDFDGLCTYLGGFAQPFFQNPFGVAEDPQGRVVVSEYLNGVIHVCTRDVMGSCAIMFGSNGSSVGQFDFPREIAVDADGKILVADRNNDRIQICDDTGSCTAFGQSGSNMAGTFLRPNGVAVNGQGQIIVADTNNNRIQVCSYQGDCSAFGGSGSGPGQFNNPRGVAVDYAGRIVVADQNNHRVQVCSTSGQCTIFGEFGSGQGQFTSPLSVAADSQGHIVVSDSGNFRVQIFLDSDFGTPQLTEINQGLNDAWVSEGAPFQGFFFTVYPNLGLLFMSWFTFDSMVPTLPDTATFGAFDHRWVTAVGAFTGTSVTLKAELTSGGVFNDSDPVATQTPNYGTITVEFLSCSEAILTYDFPSLGLSGQMTLRRVLPFNIPLCQALEDAS